MSERFKLDGDRWEIGVEPAVARPDRTTIVFHCVSNPQRPYRVIEVPAEPRASAADEGTVARWFAQSHVMDYTHDPAGRIGQRPGESL